jgi:hypothetical protein
LIAPLDSRMGALSGGSRAPSDVKGDASYASQAQHQSRDDSALHALRRLPTIASALNHHKERFPDNVSTRGDVDAYSRAVVNLRI